MLEAELTALVRDILDEVCAEVPPSEIATRQRVAAKILEAARKDHWSVDDVRQAAREALNSAPTMWR